MQQQTGQMALPVQSHYENLYDMQQYAAPPDASDGDYQYATAGGRVRGHHSGEKRKMSNQASLPDDGFRWRKYGEKPIGKRSATSNPNPRQYYRCSTVDGCPARKYVQLAADGTGQMDIRYEGEHNHEGTAPPRQRRNKQRQVSPDYSQGTAVTTRRGRRAAQTAGADAVQQQMVDHDLRYAAAHRAIYSEPHTQAYSAAHLEHMNSMTSSEQRTEDAGLLLNLSKEGTGNIPGPDDPHFSEQVMEALQSVQQAYMASQEELTAVKEQNAELQNQLVMVAQQHHDGQGEGVANGQLGTRELETMLVQERERADNLLTDLRACCDSFGAHAEQPEPKKEMLQQLVQFWLSRCMQYSAAPPQEAAQHPGDGQPAEGQAEAAAPAEAPPLEAGAEPAKEEQA